MTRAGLIAILLAGAALAQAAVEKRVPRDGYDLWFRLYGSGAPVVVLSGGPGMDCDYMTPVAAALAKSGRQAILPELPGTGRSRPARIAPETVGVGAYISALEAVRTSLGFEKWSVLGHSAGAILGMQYAAAHPDRIAALILADSGPISNRFADAAQDNIGMRLTAEERQGRDAAFSKGDIAAAIRFSTPGFFYDRGKAGEFLKGMKAGSFHQDVMAVLNQDQGPPARDRVRAAAAKIACPTLVIAGRQDPFDPAIQDEIHQAIPGSQIEYIDRAGHFAWVEQPDAFFRAVNSFLGR